ncbi:MAG: GWxTD domain-containing protein, partial [Bacteroidota bacterium]|nr:GWxTD domain-containing protein [Bacteroidota bacterium]
AAPLNKDAHLFLGLAQYNLGELMAAWQEFKTAIKLMSDDERKVYEYFSAIKLLEPLLGEKLRSMSYKQIENPIRSFWKSEEPLYLTEYNERLLEHYSRVLHSNLHFGVPKKNLDGWKTDRGEIYLRYGRPLSITNYSPYSGQDTYTDLQGNNYLQHTIYAQTELWQYNNMDFSFSDYWQDGNYQFTDTTAMAHRKSQVQLYSRLYAESARRTQFEKYEFLSPSKNLKGSVSTVQFKNLDEASSKATDLYVNFSIPLRKESRYTYEWGFFCFDNSFHELIMDKGFLKDFEDKNILLREDTLRSFISSRKYNCPAQDVKLAFEVVRANDSSIFTNHGKLSIKNYSKDSLMVSDIVLSPKVEFESKSETAINRNSIWILPNPDGKFSKKDNVHIYYEIYNLAKRESGENDFEQEIIIKKKNSSSFFIGKMVGSLVRFFDSGYDRGKITSPAKVKSYGKNQQMCFMLGLDKFDSGDYEIELIVSDKVSGQKTSNKVSFELN